MRKGQPSLRTHPLCSGADPSSDTALRPARQFRDLPCHPRYPGDSFSLPEHWPTPGPANPSEPAIIRLLTLITSGFEGFLRVFNFAIDANRINDLACHGSVGWESLYRNGCLRSALFPVKALPTAHLASERSSRTWQTIVTNPNTSERAHPTNCQALGRDMCDRK